MASSKSISPPEWTVIQRRGQFDNPPDYFSSKLWVDYEEGFGEPQKGGQGRREVDENDGPPYIEPPEFWLGLKTISSMTSSGSWQLKVDIYDCQFFEEIMINIFFFFQGQLYSVVYNSF